MKVGRSQRSDRAEKGKPFPERGRLAANFLAKQQLAGGPPALRSCAALELEVDLARDRQSAWA
jgi:hypothetical protein